MEVNNEVKFIISEKGKPLALFNLYKYRLIRTRKDILRNGYVYKNRATVAL